MRSLLPTFCLLLLSLGCSEMEEGSVTTTLDRDSRSQWYTFTCESECDLNLELVAHSVGSTDTALDVVVHQEIYFFPYFPIAIYHELTADTGVAVEVSVKANPFTVFYVELNAPENDSDWSETLVDLRTNPPLELTRVLLDETAAK